ncbi:MAG TPA: PfkB family carbohydrate kinase [Candidatus Acidoferrales bacterium]|nr:PfkB family carbohydrate kinase [Candidatus Acidoferrales bacterium]
MSRAHPSPSPARAAADLTRLTEIVEQFPRQAIALLGDFVADEFQRGDIARVSREAPVLILRHRETQLFPGGGANAANNLADLGARVRPVSVVGDDSAGRALIAYFRGKGVDTSGLVRLRGWTTPVKTRFLAGWAHTVPQQVLRVDRQSPGPLPRATQDLLKRKLRAAMREGTPLLVSDYGFGVAAPELVRAAAVRSRNNRIITLDSRFALHGFRGAGITAATPNEAELEALHHASIGHDPKVFEKCGRETMDYLRLRALVVTRGRDGMVAFERGKPTVLIPVFGNEQAVDVTGAGDTVIAALTLALAAGANFVEAAHIANIAAGIAVMKRGTATVTGEELLGAIRREATGAEGAGAH